MKSKTKRIQALILCLIMMLCSMNLTVFAASETGGAATLPKGSARVPLYQTGDLGAAYNQNSVQNNNTLAYTEGTFEYTVLNGLKNFSTEIDVSAYNLSPEDGFEKYQLVINDNPELFFVGNNFNYFYNGSNNTLLRINPSYTVSKEDAATMTEEFNEVAEMVLLGIDESMTDLEKALYLHDYIVKTTLYDTTLYTVGDVPAISHTAYGCLVLNVAVCDGYSLAYSYLLKQVGIESHIVTGPGHAWNAIKLNGNYYFVDATFDDPIGSENNDKFEYVGHKYFLVTGSELMADGNFSHSQWDQDFSVTDTTYSNAPFRNVTGTYNYYKDNWYYWYYLNTDSETGAPKDPIIAKTADPMTAGSQLYSLSDMIWFVFGSSSSYWPGYQGGVDISVNNGLLYFNSPSQIFSIDLENESAAPEVVHTIDTTNGYLYGLKVLDDTLFYGVAQSPNAKETIYYLEIEKKEIPLVDFSFKKTEIELGIGGSYTATPILNPANTYPIPTATWESSDDTIATVDSNGKIVGIKEGDAVITCTINEIEKEISVHVTDLMIGDVNGDCKVDARDALKILKYVAHMSVSTFNEAAADCNGDESINASDALWVLKKTAHII